MTNNINDQNICCKICNSLNIEFWVKKKNGKNYFKCIDCDTLFLLPEPNEKELYEYYNSFPNNYLIALENQKSNYKKFNYLYDKLLKDFIKDKNAAILDIGCFTGEFLQILSQKGFKCISGIELNSSLIPLLKNKGLNINDKDLFQIEIQNNSFDVVCLFDVIEHLIEPIKYLQKIYDILKPNGIVVLTSPDVKSIIARFLKGRWPMLDGIEHINIFSREGMKKNLCLLKFQISSSIVFKKYISINHFLRMLLAWTTSKEKKLDKGILNFGKNIYLKFSFGEYVIIARKTSN